MSASKSLWACSLDCASRLSRVCSSLLRRDWTDAVIKKRGYTSKDVGYFLTIEIKWAPLALVLLKNIVSDVLPKLLDLEDGKGHAHGYPTLTISSFNLYYTPVFKVSVDYN
jgi:hypothetical protein